MNHLLAKIKGKGQGFYKVISNENFFTLPAGLDSPILYEASYTPDPDEWFIIADFSTKEYCIDFLRNVFNATEYIQLPVDKYPKIKYLVAVQDEYFYFQKLSTAQVIQKKYFTVGTAPTLLENRIIVLDTQPDALYDSVNDLLYFKNLTTINGIFKGVDVLFTDATDAETADFLDSEFIALNNEYRAEKVNKPNRKRIALAMQALNSFTPQDKNTIFGYIRDYYPSLQFNETDQNFTIGTDEDLKNLTFGIEQRYYTTIVGKQKRRANSVQTIS